MEMTPQQFKDARHKLGLSAQGMANALGMSTSSGRTVRRWEAGDRDIPGPVIRVIGFLLELQIDKARTRCSKNGCRNRAMPLSMHCWSHQ